MPLFLSRSQVSSLLSMRESIDAVEEAFRELALGTANMPHRASLQIPGSDGWLLVMPALLSHARSLATKIVTVYNQNLTRHNIPNVLATIALNDVETGRVEAVMDGSLITAMRTGAVSAVATKYLARTSSRRLGLFGAGVQARKQLQAIREVRKIESVCVYDSNRDLAKKLAQEASAEGEANVSVADSPDAVVQSSDIIATATTSSIPVFNGRFLNPGTHINAIGAFTPSTRELDSETVSKCKIVVDMIDAALSEAGDILIPLNEGVIQRGDIWAELGEVVTGRKRGRISEEEKTLFKSVGVGIQDAAVAKLVFKKAQSLGVGTQFDLDS
jgi:alanine dehydrogenase